MTSLWDNLRDSLWDNPTNTDGSHLAWRELHFARPLDAETAVEAIRAVATDPYQPALVLEARASADGVRFLLGTQPAAIGRVAQALGATAVGLTAPRASVTTARRLVVTNRRRALVSDILPISAKAILSALDACRPGEHLVLQVLLGPRLSGLVVPNTVSQPVPLHKLLVSGDPNQPMDAESRAALVKKVCEPGFCAVVRLGVVATTPNRRRDLLVGLLGGLKRLEAPNVSLYLVDAKPAHLDEVKAPLRWPLRLNVREVAAVAALPVGDDDLPGLPLLHPKPLPPVVGPFRPSEHRLVVAQATAPGVVGLPLPDGRPSTPLLTISTDALLRHLLVTGPTGVGKSVLLEHLIIQHIERGHGAVVVEPKGDLVDGVLARIPEHRRDDVVVLDPVDPSGRVVGLNPLTSANPGESSPELRADAILSVFTGLFGAALGVRSTDVLHASLLTLAYNSHRVGGTSLVQVQRLLTDPGFRSQMVGAVAGDMALGPFWAWYEVLSETNRAAVIAPLGNKLRAVLMKKSIRAVLGQARPKFDVAQIFTSNKILLVPLPAATLGQEGSALLGSLVVAAVWDAARQRARVPADRRSPVMVCLDEFQQFARLPDIEDALATSRGYGVGWVLAHQFERQLPAAIQAAVRANVRSRVAFQLAHDDATVFAAGAVGTDAQRPTAADFTALPAFHVYVSLMEQGQVQPYASGRTWPSRPTTSDPVALRRASAERYGRAAEEVEGEARLGVGSEVGVEFNGDQATEFDRGDELGEGVGPPVPSVGSRRRRQRGNRRTGQHETEPAVSGRASTHPTGHLDVDPANQPVGGETDGSKSNASSPAGAVLLPAGEAVAEGDAEVVVEPADDAPRPADSKPATSDGGQP